MNNFLSNKLFVGITLIFLFLNTPASYGQPLTLGALTRGPYLNQATTNSVILHWRTEVKTNTVVKYGTTPNSLLAIAANFQDTTQHVIKITGLSPNTLYYYAIGYYSDANHTNFVTLQGNTNNHFKTRIPDGVNNVPVRILAMGDMGVNNQNQRDVRDAYKNYIGNNYTDVWLLLGDNAYTEGTDEQFQENFFDIYDSHFTNKMVLWPTLGNHDYGDDEDNTEDHNIPYLDPIFTLPLNGESGGVPSGSERYYAFNYGNVHFIVLDGMGKDQKPNGSWSKIYDDTLSNPQVVWLKADLTANQQPWTIVAYHFPPYSMGSHDSDDETSMRYTRQYLNPILERYNVDLVLCGHSHSYERSRLIRNHFGKESTYDPTLHERQSSSAKYDNSPNSCPYLKSTDPTNVDRKGTVYVVTGSAGQLDDDVQNASSSGNGWPHKAMYYSNCTDGGALAIKVLGNRLDAEWVTTNEQNPILDRLTIIKNANKTQVLNISAGQSITLQASWDSAPRNWSTGSNAQSITVQPATSTYYTVADDKGCLLDQFIVQVNGNPLPIVATANVVHPISCHGGNDGSVGVNVVGGTNFTYAWSNGQTTPIASGLAAGFYTVTVTAPNALTTASVTLTAPSQLSGNLNTPNILTCFMPTTTLTTSAAGGVSPYSFHWSNNTYNSSANIIAPGTYTVTITDANQCSKVLNSTVLQDTLKPIALIANPTLLTCTNQFVLLNGLGSTNTLGTQYQWTTTNGNILGGAQSLQALVNKPGTYTLKVILPNSCSSEYQETIFIDTIAPYLVVNDTTLYCQGSNIVILPEVESSNLLYNWVSPVGTITTGSQLTVSQPGQYLLTIKNQANGCQSSRQFYVDNQPLILGNIAVTNVVNGDDGAINVEVFGGKQPYTYQWKNSSNEIISNVQNPSELGQGVYTLLITDAYGCIVQSLPIALLSSQTVNSNTVPPMLEIYPNPASNLIRLKSHSSVPIKRLTLRAINGDILKTLDQIPSDGLLLLPSLPTAIYFIMLELDTHTIIKAVHIQQ